MTTTTVPTATDDHVRPEVLQAALASSARPARPSPLAASLTFGWRALLKIKHVPEQLFDVTAFPILFTVLFTYLFGGALAGSPREYLQFLLPGILVMNVTMITMYTGMAINRDIEKGIFDRFRSLPIWRPAVLVGALLGDALRYTIASIVVVLLGLALGYRAEGGVLGVVAAVGLLLVFCFALSWIWTALGLKMRTPETLLNASMMVLFPLTFLSNILVDPTTMPSWLEPVVEVNPISLLVTAIRGLMAGTATAGQLTTVLVMSAAIVAVFGPLTMRLFARPR
ncbi:ABC transporter permease [Nitriliruptoraceae bacterium ZYF776]|nr:ABC transporter permease [Profundirhabdus halotolerans]